MTKMGPEFIAATEALSLIRRDSSKYARNVVGLYLLNREGWEVGHVFRLAYHFVRHIDDVLDGDRRVSVDSLSYVQDLRLQVETGNFKKGWGIAILAEHALEHLEKDKKAGDNPRLDFLRAIDGIVFDYERTKGRGLLTAEQLEDYYFRAFDPVVNIALMCTNSVLRSRDIPAMSYGQGRVYSVRDLEDDWIRGTINIPADILEKAGLTVNSTIRTVQRSAVVKEWFNFVLITTRPELVELQQKLEATHEGATNFALGKKVTPMIEFIDRYQASMNP